MSRSDPATRVPVRRRRSALALLLMALAAAGTAAAWLANRPDPSQLLERGQRLIWTDATEAERLIRRAVSASDGRHPDARLALCGVLARKGAWDEALPLFADVDKRASRADLLLDFGRLAYQAGRSRPALEALQEVRSRGTRESASALELLMVDYHERKQPGELLNAARELAQLEPDNPARWTELIGLLKAMSMDEECEATIRRAMEQNIPADFRHELRHQLVDLLIVVGESSAVSSELDQLQQREGLSPRVCHERIDLYRLEGRLDEALRLIEAAFPDLEQAPDMFASRGTIYLELARFDEAAADLERAVAEKRSDVATQFKLAEAYRGLGRSELAQRQRELAAGIETKRVRIIELLRMLPNEPDNPQLYRQLAELHRELDEREGAEKWERRAARVAARRRPP